MFDRYAGLAVACSLVLTTACASTGATFRSGVADTFLERSPWYAGAGALPGGSIAHVPVSFQAGATQPASFDPSGDVGTAVAALLADMNAFLDSAAVTRPLGRAVDGTAPDVHFGCELQPMDDCDGNGGGRGGERRMRLAVGRPSDEWIRSAATTAVAVGVDRVLVITLETGNYLPRQKNLLGSKEIELGTRHSMDVPWLTATDRPASVLQLTGALIGADGRAIRIGAEGLVARRTNALLGGIGVQALISDEDVERARTARREDLPGRPLVWQQALRDLLAQLAG